jgi:hypothetical protein
MIEVSSCDGFRHRIAGIGPIDGDPQNAAILHTQN